MKTRAALIIAVLGTTASAFAQPQTQGTITYTLSVAEWHQGTNGWINGAAGNKTGGVAGVIEPGEGARFTITATMSGTAGGWNSADGVPVGSPLTWDPTILNGSSGAGGLSGFWSGDVDLIGDGGAASAGGSWSDGTTNYVSGARKRLVEWVDSGDSGTVTAGGAQLTNIQPSQFGANAANLDHANPGTAFTGLWIPNFTASARTVNWALALGSLGLLSSVAAIDNGFGDGFTLPTALKVQTLFGAGVSVNVAAVPGPSSLALLGLGGLIAARRRRA